MSKNDRKNDGDGDRPETKLKKEQFLKLFPLTSYHIGKTCKKVGVSRSGFDKWRKVDPEFREKYMQVIEEQIDDSEERLYLLSQGIPKVKNGKLVGWKIPPHFQALKMHLNAKAKNRGYGDHITIQDAREDHSGKTDKELIEEMRELERDFLNDDDE